MNNLLSIEVHFVTDTGVRLTGMLQLLHTCHAAKEL